MLCKNKIKNFIKINKGTFLIPFGFLLMVISLFLYVFKEINIIQREIRLLVEESPYISDNFLSITNKNTVFLRKI